MATLKHPNQEPPGGWQYKQVETGLVLKSDSLLALVREVVRHRQYRSLTPTNEVVVRSEIEEQICTRLGLRDCKAAPGDKWVPIPDKPLYTLENILGFSRTILSWIAKGFKLEDMAEVQRRREICEKCPLNQPASGCKCAVLYKMINASIPKERRFESLHICGACSCSLQAKVNVPLEVIRAGETGRRLVFPVHCWQWEGNESATGPSRQPSPNVGPAFSGHESDGHAASADGSR